VRSVVLLLFACTLLAVSARAQVPPGASPQEPAAQAAKPSPFTTTVSFLAGAASGLVVHESGHVLFGAIFDANPRVAPLNYGFIPFFKIDHDPVTRREEFVISSAGLWMQYADSEWILTAKPDIRHEHAPYLKGILAFDLATSTVYSIAAFGTFGPPERDTRGMAVSLGKDGWPEPVVGVLVLAPAALDGYRYFHPEAKWAKWGSRGAKILSVALTLAAGR
jgi:hypothetical protein